MGDPTYKERELSSGYEAQGHAQKNHKRFLRFLPDPVIIRDAEGVVSYINPAFTRTFGWTLDDLKGKQNTPHVPFPLKDELHLKILHLPPDKNVLELNTKRIAKNGTHLDVAIRVGIDRDENNQPAGMIAVLRDVTMEQRNQRTRSAMNRISQALPQYPGLRNLMQYVIMEIKEFLGTEGANVILLDKTGKEFYFLGVAHDDPSTRERIEKIRFPIDELISGQVVKTGKPIMLSSLPEKDQALHRNRDKKLGHKVKNLLVVPLHIKNQIIGVITADNKKHGEFDKTDLETLNTISATVALSIENARVSESLRKANEDLIGLNAAKDKMISHLSHELKTPVAILLSSIKILTRKIEKKSQKGWKTTIERINRNLNRIIGIEDEVYDIVEKKSFAHAPRLGLVLVQCRDLIESLISEKKDRPKGFYEIQKALEKIFTQQSFAMEKIELSSFVQKRLNKTRELFSHRTVDVETRLSSYAPIEIPQEPLEKIVDGLIRNAIENTPDNGKIVISIIKKELAIELEVKDHGIGLTPRAQKQIWDGFFTPDDTLNYSSKRPYDFGAGGKGADLLRMKIFSERYRFKIQMNSRRCRHLPLDTDNCPGSTGQCLSIHGAGCNGSTTVTLMFPIETD